MDFNIHICCHGKLLVEGFLDLMGSFNFMLPTHEKGHTLDIVFSLGLSICYVDMPVIFSVNALNEMRVSQSSYGCSCIITPSTPQAFGEIFSTFSDQSLLESASIEADPD